MFGFGASADRRSHEWWFYASSVISGKGWQVWRKPKGYSMLAITCVGSAGGGGGGAGNAAASAKGGGGGGGASSICRIVYPMVWVPDVLYVAVHHGGLGGNGGTSGNGSVGGSGQLSYVSIVPDDNYSQQNLYAISGAVAAVGGNQGTTGGGGSGGGAGTIPIVSDMAFSYLSHTFLGLAGQAGTAGGAHTGANGTNAAPPTNSFLSGGLGGGGSQNADFIGGGVAATANSPFLASAGGPAASDGAAGFRYAPWPICYPGTGGGSSNSTTGGRGGMACGWGVFGVGGGGGGAGTPTGGRGGDGAPGLVLMYSF